MRYVEVEFRPGGKRYTYHHEGPEPIEAGIDRVEIDTNDGLFAFKVFRVHEQKPKYATKPIKAVCARPPAPEAAP